MEERILTADLIYQFKEHLVLEERSENTIEKYIRDIKAFMAYSNGGEITKEFAIAYKNKLKASDYVVRSIN